MVNTLKQLWTMQMSGRDFSCQFHWGSSRQTADWPAALCVFTWVCMRVCVSVWSICCCVSPRGVGLRERARDKVEKKKEGRKRWKDTQARDRRCVFECVCCTSGGAVCASLWIPDGARTQQNTLVHLACSHSHVQTHSGIQRNSPDGRITWASTHSVAKISAPLERPKEFLWKPEEARYHFYSYLNFTTERNEREDQLPGWDQVSALLEGALLSLGFGFRK